MEYSPLPKIDLLIVDEFYKMSLRRIDERATTLNNAFLKIVSSSNTQFYLLGPNIDDITPEFKEKYSALFYRTTFSLVDCNVIDVSSQFNHSLSDRKQEEEKLPVLFKLLDSLRDSQTLIYCSSPARARRFPPPRRRPSPGTDRDSRRDKHCRTDPRSRSYKLSLIHI